MPEDNNPYQPQTPPVQPQVPPVQPQQIQEPQPQSYQPQPPTQYPVMSEELAAVEQETTTQPQQSQEYFSPEVTEQPFVAAPAPIVENQVQPKSPNKKKKLIIASIIAGAVLLLGGGAYATYALWYQNPEKVLTDAVSNVIKAKTAVYKGTLAVDTNDAKIRVEFDGKQASQLSGEGNAKITISSQGKDFTVNGSALVDKDGNLFFKIGNLKAILDDFMKESGMASSPFDDLIAKIDNKWIRISADDLAEFNEDASKAQKCAADTLKKIENDKAVHDGLVKAYEKNKFVVIDSSLPGRTIGGVDSMGYKLSFNKDAAKKFAEAVNEMQFMKDLQKCDSSFKSFKLDASDVTDAQDKNTTKAIEVSVSRWTHEFTQLKVTDRDDGTSGEFILEPTFGKAVTVTAPTDFMTLKQLQSEIESAMMAVQDSAYGSIQSRAQASQAQANANLVIKKAETYNALESKYPTLAELKAGVNAEARLSPDIAALLTNSPLTTSTPTLLQYELCSAAATGGRVSYVDTTTNTVAKLTFGDCTSSLL